MIPLRLYLKGFMSFRDETTLEFESDSVFMLSGPNGVGKSTVFDAILFALYGETRAGATDKDQALHRPGVDEAIVSFDFRLDGKNYRAQRSLKRKSQRSGEVKTDSLATLSVFNEEANRWQEVPGTSKVKDFDRWIAHHFLTYEAFTTSVLLLQGRAETLVDQDKTGSERRFEALKRIVGLEYYERLHEHVDEKRKDAKRDEESIQENLNYIPAVTDEELAAADAGIAVQDQAIVAANQAGAQLERQLPRAVEWERLLADLAKAQSEWSEAQKLIVKAEEIERDGRRAQELSREIPIVSRWFVQRERHAQASDRLVELVRKLADESGALTQATDRVSTARASEQSMAAEQDKDEERGRALAQEKSVLETTIRDLQHFAEARNQLRQAQQDREKAEQDLSQTEQLVAQIEKDLKPLIQALEKAEQALVTANASVVEAETLLEAEREREKRFATVEGTKECNYCGQELTKDHVREEKKKIKQAIQEKTKAHKEAMDSHAMAKRQRDEARKAHDALVKNLETSRRQISAQQTAVKLQGEKFDKAFKAVEHAYDALNGDERLKVAPRKPKNWLETTYPTEDALTRVKEQQKRLDAEVEKLRTSFSERKKALTSIRAEITRHENDCKRLGREVGRLETEKATEEEKARSAQEQFESARGELSAEWRALTTGLDRPSVDALARECDELKKNRATDRWEELRKAHSGSEILKQRVSDLEARKGEFPDAERRMPGEVQEALRTSRAETDRLTAKRAELLAGKKELLDRRERRRETEQEFARAGRLHQAYTKLAGILNARNLQFHLLRQAEVEIVANANRVLDHLSGGEFRLLLEEPAESERQRRALQIRARKTNGEEFGLSFLSGSERFRVAVSLALGIGEYASKQRRAVESVIIDEGFGCLDKNNRQLMISELTRLKNQLDSIILVSHQEEFADAFPDGYRFSLVDGATKVESRRD